MRFRRLMAASMAGVMAVSSAIVCQITASAADDIVLSTGTIGSSTLTEDAYNPGNIAKPSLTLDNKWGNAASFAGYSQIEVTFTCENVTDIENIYLIAQNGTVGWIQASTSPKAEGTITLDLSEYQEKTYEAISVLVEPKSTFKVGDNFDPKLTVTNARLVTADTREWTETELALAGLPTEADNTDVAINLGTDADLDTSKFSSEAKMIVYYTSGSDAGWGNVQVIDHSTGWTNITDDLRSKGDGVATTGEIPLSLFKGMTKVVLQNNNGAVITKVTVKDVKSYAVSCKPGEGGYSETNVFEARPGDNVTITVTPDEGYKFDKFEVGQDGDPNDADLADLEGGITKVNDTTYTFTMPGKPVYIIARFKAIPYTVTAGTNVSVDKTTATIGETVTVTTSAPDGYELDTITVNGEAITGNTFKMPAKEVTVKATFKKSAATVLAEAADAANKALDSYVGTNSTTADNVLKAVTDAINNADVTSAWDKAFAKTDATKDAAGSITGSIKLTEEKSGVTTGVAVQIEIAQLPVKDEDKVAAAKTAAEKALSGIKATNDITSDDILKKIKEAITDTEAAAEISGFTVKKATSSAEGSVTGTVKLSSGNVSDTVAISFTIDKLAKTDAEIIAEAETAAKTVTDKAAKAEDITAAAITKAINNADITVAVKSEVTKEATTTAEGETTVTVTLTLNKETKTITKTFSIAKLEETPAETGNEIKELFTESKDLGTGWDQYVEIPKSDVKIGDTIRIKVGTGSDEYHQVKIMDGGWNVLTSPEGVDEKYGTIPVDKDGYIEFVLNADDAKAISENGLIISGYDITVNGAEAVLLEDAAVNVPVVPKGGTKVDAVYTEADENGNIVEQIAVFAISEEDAKNYDSYVVTITRSSDNKKVTVIVDECYKYVTYNEGSKDVRVSSSGAYTVLLDITGISSDFGSLTIEIAPNTAKG